MSWHKLKAGALQLTLHIVIVIGLLLAAFVLLVHIQKRFKLQTSFVKETIENCDRGINYILTNTVTSKDTISINLRDEAYKALKVHKSYWGVFEKAHVVSNIKTHQFKKTALIGGTQLELNRPSLYLEDTKTPLVLVGKSKIEGVAYLPAQGVKSGYISGESYNGSQLIYGRSKVISTFPKLPSEWLSYLKTIELTGTRVENNQYLQVESNESYSNSFSKSTQLIYGISTLNLSGIALTGNIIVQSKSQIIIDASSSLKDVILIAPKIIIKDNVKGNFQAIASKIISVGKNVELSYPSSLILNEKQTPQIVSSYLQQPDVPIEIKDNSTIVGQIIFNGKPKTNNYNSQIYISDSATVKGEVYCNQNVELLGRIEGTAFVHNFLVHKGGSIYQNHIYNGEILINKLPQEYAGISFKTSKKAVAKWLY